MNFDELPIQLPLDVVLLSANEALLAPQGVMPMVIDEPHMKAAVDMALAEDRLIGVVQKAPPTHKKPRAGGLYDVGCLGRITGFTELDGNKYLVLVMGLCRFDLVRSRKTRDGYRRADVSYRYFLEDVLHTDAALADREKLIDLVHHFFEGQDTAINWEELTKATDQKLLSMLTMAGPFTATEKQALLERREPEEQASLVEAFIEMSLLKNPNYQRVLH